MNVLTTAWGYLKMKIQSLTQSSLRRNKQHRRSIHTQDSVSDESVRMLWCSINRVSKTGTCTSTNYFETVHVGLMDRLNTNLTADPYTGHPSEKKMKKKKKKMCCKEHNSQFVIQSAMRPTSAAMKCNYQRPTGTSNTKSSLQHHLYLDDLYWHSFCMHITLYTLLVQALVHDYKWIGSSHLVVSCHNAV